MLSNSFSKKIDRNINNRKKIINIIASIFFIFFTLVILYKNISDIPPIQTMNFLYLPLCFLSYSIFLLIAANRYLILVKKFGLEKIQFGLWFKIYILGRFFNKFIPQAGNLFRAVILKSNHNFSYKKYTASMIAFQWIETVMNLSISLIIIQLFNPSLLLGPIRANFVVLFSLCIVLLSPFIIKFFLKIIKWKGDKTQKLKKIFNEIVDSIINGFLDIIFFSKIILWGLLSMLLMTVFFLFIFNFINIFPGFVTICIYMSLMRLILIFHFIPGNLGIQELLMGFLTEATGIGIGVGIVFSLIMRIIVYLALGIFSLSLGGISFWKDIKKRNKTKT